MCGIAGIISRDPVKKEDLKPSVQCLAHRGPDAQGFWLSQDSRVLFGHQRLSILDLSAEANQPMMSNSDRSIISFNGEIYNYHEIAQEMVKNKQVSRFRTTSDTEVILEAFECYGPNFVEKLNGMFTIAIYDKKNSSSYIYRDRVGIKPLYYFLDENRLLFASELKGIESYPGIKDRLTLNHSAVSAYLHLGYVPEPYTIWSEIKKFPAGAMVKIGPGMVTEWKTYWSPEDHPGEDPIEDLNSAKNQLEALLDSSVTYRMISDVPLGTFLSGGIDSSLVTTIASKSSTQRTKTFTIGFEESKFDESVYARKIAEHLNTDHTELTLSEKEAIPLVDEILNTFDEPFADSSSVSTLLVSSLARKHVKVILTGDGGDELFHGYGSYHWAKRLAQPGMNLIRQPVARLLRLGNDRYRRVADLMDYPDIRIPKSHIFSQEQYYFTKSEISKLAVLPEIAVLDDINKEFNGTVRDAAQLQSQFDIRYYLRDDLLVKVDRASMKYGLECRVPLLDHRLIEFSNRVSAKLKIRNGESKFLLKQVLYDHLPKAYFDRPKWGFGVPINKWLKNDLQHLIHNNLNQSVIEGSGLVKFPYVESLILKFKDGHDRYYNRLWQLIVLHQWAQKNL